MSPTSDLGKRTSQLGTIRYRLPLAFALVVLLSVAAITVGSGLVILQGGRQQAISQLESVAALKENEIKNWINVLHSDLAVSLNAGQMMGHAHALLQESPESPSYQLAYGHLQTNWQQLIEETQRFEELFLIDRQGQVILSTDITWEGKIFDNQTFFQRGLEGFYMDSPHYHALMKRLTMVATLPVVDQQGQVLGVMAGRANMTTLNEIMLTRAGLGQTGETYLVSGNHALLTPLRFGQGRKTDFIRTEGVNAILKSKSSGSGVYDGYRDEPTIGVYRWLPELHVALLAEQAQTEALRAVYSAIGVNLIIALFAVILAVSISLFISHSITAPLASLVQTATQISAGDLTLGAEVKREDEIGALALAFNNMTARLRDLIGNLEQRVVELAQAEKAVRESEERLQFALEAATDALFDWNMQTDEAYFNPRYYTMLGYEPREMPAPYDTWINLLHPEDREYVIDTVGEYTEGKRERHEIEYRMGTKSGEWRWILSRGRIVERDDSGRPLRLVGTHVDITERRHAEEALQASERRYRLLFERNLAGVYRTSLDGHILDCNESFAQILGYDSREEVLRCKAGDLYFNTADRQSFLTQLQEQSAFTSLESCLRRKDGSPVWILESASLIKEVESALPIIQGTLIDITERKRAEEALRESNRRLEETLAELRETQEKMVQQERLAAVGQLAAGIAHDFNNILASMVLYTQMSLRTDELSPQARQRLETVARQAKRATDLIQQILDFSRRAVIERRPLILESFLGEVVELLKRTLPENILIDLICEPVPSADGTPEVEGRQDHTIEADPTRIQQAIVNLALNARDAMPGGGELRIALSRTAGPNGLECVTCGQVMEGEWVQVTVTDTGTGIPPNVLPHIFEPFFTTRAPLGSGLGLAQVYGIVKQHEGHIAVETELGHGTTFKLYWPTPPVSQPQAPTEEWPTLTEGNGETILVVEDDPAMRAALVDALETLNYHTLEAADGREALATFEQHESEILLIMSDWVMPLMGGLELVRELRRRRSAVKVLMLTGHPLDKRTEATAPEGVIGWLLKPPGLKQLADAVALAVERQDDKELLATPASD